MTIDLGNAENKCGIGPLEVLGVVRAEVVAEQAVKAYQLLELDLVEESFQTVLALERVQCLKLDLQLAYDGIDHLFLEGTPLCEVRRQLLQGGSLLLDRGGACLEHLEEYCAKGLDDGEDLLI